MSFVTIQGYFPRIYWLIYPANQDIVFKGSITCIAASLNRPAQDRRFFLV